MISLLKFLNALTVWYYSPTHTITSRAQNQV